MKPVVVVENIYKKYSRNANTHLSYGIYDLAREIFGLKHKHELRKDEFNAVENISFALNPGDSFGLIGRNGSGKTTILKMLNGLSKPDQGRIIIDGRVQALIALGAGFNPKLSGIDNIYNSAALMGMSRKETHDVVDEIIAFAELDEFIDSPVDTYSSGMYARLGFAVSIHLKPDILLIDEILAVGDVAFQNKCFIRLHQMKKEGVTIILVSHSHTQISQLCDQALWIHQGRERMYGPAKEVIKEYLAFLDEDEARRVGDLNRLRKENEESAKKNENLSIYGGIYDEFDQIDDLKVTLIVNGIETDTIRFHDSVVVRYSFRLKRPVHDLNVSLSFWRKDGLHFSTISTLNGDLVRDIHSGMVECEVSLPDFSFNPGEYVLVMPIHEGHSYLYRDIVKTIRVIGTKKQMTWGLVTQPYEYRVLSGGRTIYRSGEASEIVAGEGHAEEESVEITQPLAIDESDLGPDLAPPVALSGESAGKAEGPHYSPLYEATLEIVTSDTPENPASRERRGIQIESNGKNRSGLCFSIPAFNAKSDQKYLLQCKVHSAHALDSIMMGLKSDATGHLWAVDPVSGSTKFCNTQREWSTLYGIVNVPRSAEGPFTVWLVNWEPLRVTWNARDMSLRKILCPMHEMTVP